MSIFFTASVCLLACLPVHMQLLQNRSTPSAKFDIARLTKICRHISVLTKIKQ
jgi:hypothetical protein